MLTNTTKELRLHQGNTVLYCIFQQNGFVESWWSCCWQTPCSLYSLWGLLTTILQLPAPKQAEQFWRCHRNSRQLAQPKNMERLSAGDWGVKGECTMTATHSNRVCSAVQRTCKNCFAFVYILQHRWQMIPKKKVFCHAAKFSSVWQQRPSSSFQDICACFFASVCLSVDPPPSTTFWMFQTILSSFSFNCLHAREKNTCCLKLDKGFGATFSRHPPITDPS